jgi:type II secretory pathway component PulJ
MALIEIMVTLGLFLAFLAAAGGLVTRASRVLRFSEAKANSLRALTFALDRMARDLSAAQAVITPASGNANNLAILMVDASTRDRLYPNPAPASFPIRQLNVDPYMVEVRYSVAAETLQREALKGGSSVSLSRVAERVMSLLCTRRADGLMELRIQAVEERGPRTVSTAVALQVGVP